MGAGGGERDECGQKGGSPGLMASGLEPFGGPGSGVVFIMIKQGKLHDSPAGMNLSKVIAKRPFILLRSVEDVEKDAIAVILRGPICAI